ncbi:MAG: hypothetical protein GX558_05185, partial [Clostridiales bacterium]|nr:hypothetical protein [Clostridiales bacterium]
LTGVYSPSSYLPSKANGVLAELFPSFPKLLEQPAAIDPPLITAIHDEIVWTSIRDVTAEAAIVKTSFEDVTTQIEKAIQEVLDRYKLTL